MDNRAKGRVGEDVACSFLEKKGYEILIRNFFTRYGEVDIIAKDHETLVFIEVKKRSSQRFGTGAQAVTSKKMDKIRKCASLYIQKNKLHDQKMRFDVIDIQSGYESKINHIKAAF